MSPKLQPRAIERSALGLGLRLPHYAYIQAHKPRVDYFEIIAENFLDQHPLPQRNLDSVLAHYPVVIHSVGLNLLGHEPLDEAFLDKLAALVASTGAAYASDHLCWTGAHKRKHHDLLPLPYREDLIAYAAQRAAYIQKRLGIPFGIENLSSYLSFSDSNLEEWDFYSAVVREAGCWYMLDINNIYVSSQNHQFDPVRYLQSIDFSRVLQVHLAGHQKNEQKILVDTHDAPVADAVWDLYRAAWAMGGPFPTVLEWDADIPPMPVLLAELEKAKGYRL